MPKGTIDPRAEQERPVFERGERDGEVGRIRRVLAQADDAEDEDDSARDEDGFDDPRRDVTDREQFVLSPHDRVEHNGGSDIRDDQQQLQEGAKVDLAVLPVTGDVSSRVVENGLEESQRADRRDERDQEEDSEDSRSLLVLSHSWHPTSTGMNRETYVV